MIVKKIGFAIIYILVGIVVNSIAQIFGFGVMSMDFSNIIIISIAICALSYNLRIIKIKKQNKGMESEEHAVFNDTAKAKISFITKSADFKVEAIMYVVLVLIYIAMAYFDTITVLGMEHFLEYIVFNILITIVGLVLIPSYMAVLDLFVWYMAYNRCYKTKAY